jgi:hypothetical protein
MQAVDLRAGTHPIARHPTIPTFDPVVGPWGPRFPLPPVSSGQPVLCAPAPPRVEGEERPCEP